MQKKNKRIKIKSKIKSIKAEIKKQIYMNFNLKYTIETNLNFNTEKIQEFQTKLEIKSLRIKMKLKFIINCY